MYDWCMNVSAIENSSETKYVTEWKTNYLYLKYVGSFGTVSHDILIKQLFENAAITGTVLNGTVSYLTYRRKALTVKGMLSDELSLGCGVPQGSGSGPLYFLIYTLPLGEILRRHCLNYPFYTDDDQDYLSFRVKNVTET